MVRERVCVSSLAVEFLPRELGLGFDLVGFAVVFTLLAFRWRLAARLHIESKADGWLLRDGEWRLDVGLKKKSGRNADL